MTIDEFIRAKRQGFRGNKPQIDKRWNERIAPNGWDKQGRTGADAYLAKYGTGIKVPKLVDIALKAESEFATDFANRFWEEAYRIETGVVATVAKHRPRARHGEVGCLSRFYPARTNLGDAARRCVAPEGGLPFGQRILVHSGQGGDRCLLFATPSEVIYQVNSGSTQNSLDPVLDQALAIAASTIGPFILDAEELYRDANAVAHAYRQGRGQGEPEAQNESGTGAVLLDPAGAFCRRGEPG